MQSAKASFVLPRPVAIIGSVVVLTPLMAMLAVALTMLTRMLVEREQEPDLHLPTFWVWFALCMAGIAVPILIHEIRGPRHKKGDLPAGARVWLTFLREEAGPVTQVSLQLPEAASPDVTLVRAHELEPSDVPLLDELTDVDRRLAIGSDDNYELTARGIAALTASQGTLRSIVDELLARPSQDGAEAGQLEPVAGDPDIGAGDADVAAAPVSAGSDHGESQPGSPALTVPHGPARRTLARVGWVLIAVLVGLVVLLLVWRGVSDAGVGPDIDDHEWAVSLGAGSALVGPFLIWGWFGLLHLVTLLESRSLSRPIAAQARENFWFFGLCSAFVMVFLGLLVTMAVWITTDGALPTLISVAVTGLFWLLGQVSLTRWRASRR